MAVATSGSSRRGARAQLTEYRRKRDFTKTLEPAGGESPSPTRAGRLRFVIQKHAASHLHFDLRLERDSVMKSWAVQRVDRGSTLAPADFPRRSR